MIFIMLSLAGYLTPNVNREVVLYESNLEVKKKKKKKSFSNFILLCNFLVRTLQYFKKKHKKKLPSKVAHNPTRPRVFSPASFCFVQLRQFFSLTFSHLWSFQTLQVETRVSFQTTYLFTFGFNLGVYFIFWKLCIFQKKLFALYYLIFQHHHLQLDQL